MNAVAPKRPYLSVPADTVQLGGSSALASAIRAQASQRQDREGSKPMARRLIRWALLIISLLLASSLALGAFTVAKNQGLLSPFGIESESHDSQVVNAIERTEEVSLVSLAIQGIKEKAESAKLFGKRVPGTSEKVFLQYNFNAKLGVDGADVRVVKTGKSAYRVAVPKFKFIGYDKPTFKVAAVDGSVLSWAAPDVDQVEMINEILNGAAQQTYLKSYDEELKSQTKTFYDTLITSIDPAAVTTFEFMS